MSDTVTLPNGREFRVVARGNDRSHPSAPASKPRKHKFNAQAVVVDGVRFASKAEAARDAELRLLERAGKIMDLKRQPKFDLVVNGRKVCRYIGDWQYLEVCEDHDAPVCVPVVEDRKGHITPAFKIKWALAKALHPEIEWRLS